MRLALLALSALLACAALVSASAALGQSNDAVHASEIARFGYGQLRPGANGNDPKAPNASNANEAKVGELPVPALLPAGVRWQDRRDEIARLVERGRAGEIPAAAGHVMWPAFAPFFAHADRFAQ